MERRGGTFIDWYSRYCRQKYHARRRGIPFLLTFSQWIMWWGADIWKRGRGDGKLQMCRRNDEGAYELGNIFKATCNQNSSEKFANGKNGFRPSALTPAQVNLIQQALEKGDSQRFLAKKYGVSQRTINRINLGQYRPVSSMKEIH